MGVLDGKAAVVTGSGRGLGRAYARAMGRAGARIVVNDIDVDEAEKTVSDIKAEGGIAVANGDSVVDWDGARRMLDQCVNEFGQIDTLVNNAGIIYNVPFIETTREQINATVAVNLLGSLNTARQVVDYMIPRKQGCVINVASGAQSGIFKESVYGATKAGVASITYSMALELAQHNIRVNALSPLAYTRMGLGGKDPGDEIPEGRWSPENVAPLAVFLASDDAWYVTGQVVRLEGNVLSLLSHPKIVHPVMHNVGWSLEEIRKFFKETLGSNLQPVGLRAQGYAYYEGLDKGPKSREDG